MPFSAVSLPAQGTAAAKGQEATKGSALPNQSEAQKESGEATGSAAPKGPEEIILPADNGNKASFIGTTSVSYTHLTLPTKLEV